MHVVISSNPKKGGSPKNNNLQTTLSDNLDHLLEKYSNDLSDKIIQIIKKEIERLSEHYQEAVPEETVKVLKEKLTTVFPPTRKSELKKEFGRVFSAARGRFGYWKSVLETANLLLEQDYRAKEMKKLLPYKERVIYRALRRLYDTGFCQSNDGVWTIDKNNCPLLYWFSRTEDATVISITSKKEQMKILGRQGL
jgi:hypothetical protein